VWGSRRALLPKASAANVILSKHAYRIGRHYIIGWVADVNAVP